MDLVRSCYRSLMRPFRDRPDVKVPGKWKFCPAGAKPLPFWHIFGSSNWDWLPDYHPELGEDANDRGSWYRGDASPFYLGDFAPGHPSVWQEGFSYAGAPPPLYGPEGIPISCHVRLIVGGGDADAGTAIQGHGFTQLADGGDAEDGLADQWADATQLADGGDAEDGLADQWADATQLADGGDAEDGAAEQLVTFLQVASGGDGDDGEGEQTVANQAVWVPITVSYTDLFSPGTVNTFTAYTSAAGEYLHAVVWKATELFAGGSITAYQIIAQFNGTGLHTVVEVQTDLNGAQAIGYGNDTSLSWPDVQTLGPGADLGSWTVEIYAESVGDNLDAATQGEITLWLLISTLP